MQPTPVPPTTGRHLYSGTRNASSWAFRAWLALREAGVPFEETIIDIRRPQRFSNLHWISTFSPPAAVPVLVDEGEVIFDSLAIMEYANELGDGHLLPTQILARAKARAFMAWQHAGMANLCKRLSFESAFYPDRRAMTRDERHDAALVFDAWEASLRRFGGEYLAGPFSLADIAVVPSVMRLVHHADDLMRWPAVDAWSRRLLDRPWVRQWNEEAMQCPPVRLADYMP